MTDEQIKQNAEDWVKPLIGEKDGGYNKNDVSLSLMKNAFIAGAHSRDEEIEVLEHQLNNTSINLKIARKELDKLRNPWISVKYRMPEKIKNKGVSKNVFVTWPDGTLGEVYYNYEEYKAPRWEIKGAGIMKPAYWMPIPELKKGGKK